MAPKLTDWPEGFERGIPTAEGCYACIVHISGHGRDRYAIELLDIQEFGKLAADELGIEPGLHVCDEEGCLYTPDEYGVVGYHRVCKDSGQVTATYGFKGMDSLLKLNEAGIDFYLKYYRRELERLRVKDWPLGDTPPMPPVMPPMPQFSRSFFVEAV